MASEAQTSEELRGLRSTMGPGPGEWANLWGQRLLDAIDRHKESVELMRSAWDAYGNQGRTLSGRDGVDASQTGGTSGGDGYGQQKPVNLYYSNIETMKNHVFSQAPIPISRRRVGRESPAERVAAKLIQDCLRTCLDCDFFDYDFEEVLSRVRDDFMIPGRGMAELEYVKLQRTTPVERQPVQLEGNTWKDAAGQRVPGTLVTRDESGGMTGTYQPKAEPQSEGETVMVRYMDPTETLIHPTKRWMDAQWVATVHQLTYDELVAKIGSDEAGRAKFNELPMWNDATGGASRMPDKESVSQSDHYKRARVFRIFDKPNRQIIWLDLGERSAAGGETTGGVKDGGGQYAGPTILKIVPDHLGIQGFFPFPKPLQTVMSNHSQDPVTEFSQYSALFHSLQENTARIYAMGRALKPKPFVNSSHAEAIKRAYGPNSSDDVEAVPLTEMGPDTNIANLIQWPPFQELSNAMNVLSTLNDSTTTRIFEVSGIDELQRGISRPRETATAQRVKVEYGSGRLQERRRLFARFCRSLLRKMVEIICAKFEWQSIRMMSGVEIRSKGDIDKEVAEIQEKMQAAETQQMGAPQQGQDPEELKKRLAELEREPTEEDVEKVIRDDYLRYFSIDIETNSTIQGDRESENAGRAESLSALAQALEKFKPYVDLGLIPYEFLNELVLAHMHGMPMSSKIIQLLEQFDPKPPEPPPNPDEIKAELAENLQKEKLAHDGREKQKERDHKLRLEQLKQQGEQQKMQSEQAKMELALQIEKIKLEVEQAKAQIEIQKAQAGLQVQKAQDDQKIQTLMAEAEARREADRQKTETQRALDRQKVQTAEDLGQQKVDQAGQLADQQVETAKKLGNQQVKNARQMAEAQPDPKPGSDSK